MDSLFSLFDPTDGNQNKHHKKRHKADENKKRVDDDKKRTEGDDCVKKKTEGTGKGRRRGRKSCGKHETLPEESSFLCEPELSTEILVKDVSYIDNYIEINKRDDESKTDADRKPKRRNSGRKSRRKKYKTPPAPLTPNLEYPEPTWNNQKLKPSISGGSIGKNVNDLKSDDFKNKRSSDDTDIFIDNTGCMIDKLKAVSLNDDWSCDINSEFDKDFHYDDGIGDYVDDDSTSEQDDSSEEVYGNLPPEPRFGNVEYKLQLVSLCEKRFQHLVTQLKWRLRSGGGSCVYVIGVRDCGALVGLRLAALRASLRALRLMARALAASVTHVAARRLAANRAVAEVYITKLADPQQSVELRVAVMGANEAGKSTLIGVLTQGELDNGRGSARLNMFRHQHEVKSGNTSSLSHEILGFDAQGNVVNYGCSELMTAERIGERSAKLVSFLDLAGHSKYQRTTLHGLTGYSPHYSMLVVSATAGVTRITEEHLCVLLALRMPLFAVITKCELAHALLPRVLQHLEALLAPAGKKPLLITDENLARNCVGPQKLILDTIDADKNENMDDNEPVFEHIPVFPVSCVKGFGLNALHAYLLALQPPAEDVQPKPEDDVCEFQIDEIFHVGDPSGPVVGGLLTRGQLFEGDDVIIGPQEDGSFSRVRVRSIHRNRVRVGACRRGQPASLGLPPAPAPRPGQVLLATPDRYKRGPRPSWGGCPPGGCRRRNEAPETMDKQHAAEKTKNKKNVRRKNLNILSDIEDVEQSLAKPSDDIQRNLYESEGEEQVGGCSCDSRVFLEDPDDPRGCLFFQASVHVLRHSTAIYPGFQCTVHVGNVRQTAIIEGIMSRNSLLRAGEAASVLFRFVRCPEYLVTGRQLLFTAGLGTRGVGRITQIFPYVP